MPTQSWLLTGHFLQPYEEKECKRNVKDPRRINVLLHLTQPWKQSDLHNRISLQPPNRRSSDQAHPPRSFQHADKTEVTCTAGSWQHICSRISFERGLQTVPVDLGVSPGNSQSCMCPTPHLTSQMQWPLQKRK